MSDAVRRWGARPYAAAAAAALLFVACSSPQAPEPDTSTLASLALEPKPAGDDSPIVARVSGPYGERVITAAQLARAWRERPELEQRRVLEALIDQEHVLGHWGPRWAQEASPREQEQLAQAHQRGLVRAWLWRVVEDAHRAQPQDPEVAARRQLLAQQRRVPASIQATHLLVMAPLEVHEPGQAKPRQLTPQERAPLLERAERFARERLAPELSGQRWSVGGLELWRDLLAKQAQQQGLSLVVNAHMRFPWPDDPAPATLPEGWILPVPEFARAAASWAVAAPRGHVSDPVMTPFGAHLIVIEDTSPGIEVEPEQAQAQALKQIQEERQHQALQARLTALLEGASILRWPEAIGPSWAGLSPGAKR